MACGHKNVFEVSKPKFCAGCGSPFNSSIASEPDSHTDLEDVYTGTSFDIKKLRASIISESKGNNKSTLDQIWSDPAPRSEGSSRSASNDPSGKEIIHQTMSECSSSKQPKDIDG